jgi:FixJ family two-component response regulator
VTLTEQEREQLQRWARRAKSAQMLAQRAKIVLACADGAPNKDIASDLHVHPTTVTEVADPVREAAPGWSPRRGTGRVATLEQTRASHYRHRMLADAIDKGRVYGYYYATYCGIF